VDNPKLNNQVNTAALSPAPPASSPPEPKRSCMQPAPDRSGRTCDKPRGHDGEHWTYGGHTLTWASSPPERSEGWRPIDNGNPYVFCDYVTAYPGRGCIRGAGHSGPHVVTLPPYPQTPAMALFDSPAIPPEPSNG
jgi:hypothetical protein